jgi:hypothetical protein
VVVITNLPRSKATGDTTNTISTERLQHNPLMAAMSSTEVAPILRNRANTLHHHTPLTSHRLQVHMMPILHLKAAMTRTK